MAQLLSTNVSGTLAVTQNTTVSGNLIVSGYNILNEVFQADNAVRVSANSGSTLPNVSLNFVNTATVTVSVTSGGTGVANIGFTSTATGTGTLNNFPVSVNTISTITSNGINFVNTSSVSVTVSQGIGGNANISFTASPAAGVTQVATGLGLTGGPITSTGTISANIASTTVQGVTKLIDSVTSTDAANAATGAAVKTAFDQATTAYGQANSAFAAANTGLNKAQVSANGGSIQSNVGINFINTASVLVSVGAGSTGNANVGFSAVAGSTAVPGILQLTDSVTSTSTTTAATPNSVKSAFDQATLAYGQANGAFAAANTGLNKAQVSANGGSVQSNVGINFNNTASVLVSVGAGTTGNANVTISLRPSIIVDSINVATLNVTSIKSNGTYNFSQSSNNTVVATDFRNPNTGTLAAISHYSDIGPSGEEYCETRLELGLTSFNAAKNLVINFNSAGVTSNTTLRITESGAPIATFAANGDVIVAKNFFVGSTNVAPAITSAANTVQVSANSGGTLSNKSLNFNNTATIRVNLGSGAGSNANLSFDFIGSVTGGSGINNFPVSANSGSTVTANGLNFVNTSTVTVTVTAGLTGNANIALTSSNLFYSGLSTSQYANIGSTRQMMEWTHNRDYGFNTVSSGTLTGVFANTNGTRLYVSDSTNDVIYQLQLSEGWNIASATSQTSFNVSTQESAPVDLFFQNTGSTLYVLGDGGNDITYYTLGTPWDITTASFVGQTSISGQTTAPTGIFFRDDGLKLWVTSVGNVYPYNLTTPWDISTGFAYDPTTAFTPGAPVTVIQSISFSPDGKYMYLVNNSSSFDDYIYEYILGTPWDASTATFTGNRKYIRDRGTNPAGESSPTGIFVAYSNNRMYVAGSGSDVVMEWKLDEGISIDAENLFVDGRGTFNDDVWVYGDFVATEALLAYGGISAGSGQQFTVSGSTGAVAAPSITISGTTTLQGALTTSGNNSIDLGVGTGNTITNVAIGATLAGNTKNVRIGTGGTAGSLTNILIGPSAANATINVFANTTTFSNSVDIQGQLTVAGLNIINEIGIADNLARVSANSGSIQSAVALNFINTATVQVSVTPGETGFANIALTSSGSSGVTSVDTGLGLTGGPITSTGTISANIATTTVQGITKLIDSVTSTDTANAATGAAVKVAFDQATSAYGKANTAHETAVAAYQQANSGLNKTQVSANNGSIQSNVSINFVNTSSLIVSVGAGSAGNANVGFSAVQGTTSIAGILQLTDSITSTSTTTAATPNSVKIAYDLASVAANQTSVSANSGSLINDASLNFNNTATIQVSVTAGVSGNANVSFNSHIANGSITSAATISPLRTGPHNHYAVTALATAATIEPPAVNTGKDGDRLTLRIEDNGTGRGLTWNTAAGAYRAIGVTLPTTTVATKVLYIGSIYNSTDNFWDVVAYVVQA